MLLNAPGAGENAPALILVRTSSALAVILLVAVSSPASLGEELKVSPAQATLLGPLDRVQLTLTAAGDDRPRDVTRSATFHSLNPEIVVVSANGSLRPLSDGEGAVQAHWEGARCEVRVRVSGCNSPAPPSFRKDVIPVLNRTGCNSGSCHASQFGKGGFKLSLFGFAPEQDHAPMVREEWQRRVSFVEPRDSLLLQKPTLAAPHGGGRRFREESIEYATLLSWIRAGGQAADAADSGSDVSDLSVSHPSAVYSLGEERQLRVVAHYRDGTARDVTHMAQYDSMGEAVAVIDETGYVTSVGVGQAPIMIRYMGQAKTSIVIVPRAASVDLSEFAPRNFVDRLVAARWRELGFQPSSGASDAEFLRRVYLDAIGTLPAPEKVREFQQSEDPHKRELVVDSLLGLTGDPSQDVFVNEWSAYWALKWGDLIRNNRNKLGDGGMWALYNWTRASLREAKPVDQFVRELITAQGSVFESGPANYFKVTTKADELAEATVQSFLGVRLQCAKCHHHPFEVYSQADYYGLAAFFTRVGNKSSNDFGSLGGDTVVMVKRSGSIKHPRTRQTMQPKVLGGAEVDPEAHRDLRRPLAEWLTSADNQLFARNIANRFWGYLMGTGLVEPIDDMRATNPASNPELLDALANYLVEQEFDLRRLMQVIMTSQVYQLSSNPRPENAADRRFYTHYNVKRLPAEVLLDAVDFACGTQEKFTGIPLGTRAIELPDPNYASYFLDTMGRPQRVVTCECERTTEPNLAQVLHLANGDVISRKVADKNGRVARLLASDQDDDRVIGQLYLATFSRLPTSDELASCRKIIESAANRREGVEDILWALCNSREFLFNH